MRDWRIVAGIAAVVGVVIGVGLGAIFGGTARDDSHPSSGERAQTSSGVPASEGPPRTSGHDSPEWTTLQKDLARERQALIWLAEEIDMLWEELELLNQRLEPATPTTDFSDAGNKAPHRSDAEPQFDDERLAANGITADEIERLRNRYETMELDKLYLHNQAAREGWLRSGRYRQGVSELDGRLREDLGEEDYDRMLFATGQTNRVLVKNVIGQSPAENAGMLAGDVILRYAGERIFNPRALRNQTTQGEPGKPIVIEIRRNREIISVSLPRGPLGIKMDSASLPPER